MYILEYLNMICSLWKLFDPISIRDTESSSWRYKTGVTTSMVMKKRFGL